MKEIDILSLLLMISQDIQLFICWKIKVMLFKKFKIFFKRSWNQLGRKIKRIRSDRGREYESSTFNSFVQFLGIIHETTAPYSLASSGVAERKSRTLIELTNAMLIEYHAHLHFWGEAILTACYFWIGCYIKSHMPHLLRCGKDISQIWDIWEYVVVLLM